jgi:putative NIF3 family GTP cyclohydrolase 1 type 2
MKVGDILEHFLSRAHWVDRSNTVDRVIVGDPDLDVERCRVAWIPSLTAIKATARQGVKLLICHEPTFWNHPDATSHNPTGLNEKLSYIRDHEMTILRLHDTWDRWPEIGVPSAWAGFLGLANKAGSSNGGYQLRYDITRTSFEQFAKSVASRTASMGQKMVETSGDPKVAVSRIGVGTGCMTDAATFLQMGCDCFILCDDGISYWQDVQYARDQNIPTITVNHGTCEEPGMVTLTDYINRKVEGLRARHLTQGCRFRLVQGW